MTASAPPLGPTQPCPSPAPAPNHLAAIRGRSLPKYQAVNHPPTRLPTDPATRPHPLVCHPGSPCPVPLQIDVSLRAHREGLGLRFQVRGALSRLRVPPPTPPEAADGLWQHTCFEAFVSATTADAYREFNWSPSGQWAQYDFSRERVRHPTPGQSPALPSRLEQFPDRLRLQAHIPTSALPPDGELLLGLSAVIELDDGSLTYWALVHPTARPDFHHRGGWQALPAISSLLPRPQTP